MENLGREVEDGLDKLEVVVFGLKMDPLREGHQAWNLSVVTGSESHQSCNFYKYLFFLPIIG